MLISLFGGIYDDLIEHPIAMDLVEDNDIVNVLTFSKIKVLPDNDMYGATEILKDVVVPVRSNLTKANLDPDESAEYQNLSNLAKKEHRENEMDKLHELYLEHITEDLFKPYFTYQERGIHKTNPRSKVINFQTWND